MQPKPYSLAAVGEGCIGKLQVRRSGRTQLVLGSVVLDMTMGTQACFLQVSITLDCFGTLCKTDGLIKWHVWRNALIVVIN